MKKLLISALVAAMVLGLGSMAFAAAGDIAPAAFSDIVGDEAEGELTLLAALGVFSGEQGLGGAVKPDDPLTRAQFCKVVVEAFEKGNMAAALAGLRPNFVDEVPAWAWGYVNVATYMGVINGYEDGTFGADKFVTYGEAITMLIRAVGGHKEQVGAGVWPYNYIFYGVDNGFNGPVDVSFASLPTTRGDMARMLFAAMLINKVNAEGAAVPDSAVLAGQVVEGVASNFAAGTLTLDSTDYGLADPVYLVGASDYAGLLGSPVLAVLTDETSPKLFFAMVTDGISTFSGVFDSWELVDGVYSLIFDGGTKVAVDGALCDLPVTLNQSPSFWGCELSADDECIVTLSSAGKAVGVVAFQWTYDEAAVTGADPAGPDTDLADITTADGPFDIPASARITLNGASATGDDLAINDVAKVALKGDGSGTVIAVSAVRNVVEGEVKGSRAVYPGPVNYVTIDTTEYKVAAGVTPPTSGIVKYGLNEAGELFVKIDYVPETPYVVVRGYTESTAGDTVDVDVRGTVKTYATDLSSVTFTVGSYGLLTIDTATGAVTGFSAIAIQNEATDIEYQVVSISGSSLTTLVLSGGASTGTYAFFDTTDFVIYKNDGTTKTYIGVEGLAVDDVIDCDSTETVWELYVTP